MKEYRPEYETRLSCLDLNTRLLRLGAVIAKSYYFSVMLIKCSHKYCCITQDELLTVNAC